MIITLRRRRHRLSTHAALPHLRRRSFWDIDRRGFVWRLAMLIPEMTNRPPDGLAVLLQPAFVGRSPDGLRRTRSTLPRLPASFAVQHDDGVAGPDLRHLLAGAFLSGAIRAPPARARRSHVVAVTQFAPEVL